MAGSSQRCAVRVSSLCLVFNDIDGADDHDCEDANLACACTDSLPQRRHGQQKQPQQPQNNNNNSKNNNKNKNANNNNKKRKASDESRGNGRRHVAKHCKAAALCKASEMQNGIKPQGTHECKTAATCKALMNIHNGNKMQGIKECKTDTQWQQNASALVNVKRQQNTRR